MKVYSIYTTEGKFVVALPTLEEAKEYGKKNFGAEAGWDYNIVKTYLDLENIFSTKETPQWPKYNPIPLNTPNTTFTGPVY